MLSRVPAEHSYGKPARQAHSWKTDHNSPLSIIHGYITCGPETLKRACNGLFNDHSDGYITTMKSTIRLGMLAHQAVLRDCCARAFHTAVLGKGFQNLECFVELLGFLEWN